jgi:hypothetical protein
MAKAKVLLEQNLDISARFRVELNIFEVEPSKKFPGGIRVSFALIDAIAKVPRLLIDNHEPFGFHVHSELPKNKHARKLLAAKDCSEALNEFWRLIEDIIKNEDQTTQNHV